MRARRFGRMRGWAYGLPELDKGQREKIRKAARVAVPGCHASAFFWRCIRWWRRGWCRGRRR